MRSAVGFIALLALAGGLVSTPSAFPAGEHPHGESSLEAPPVPLAPSFHDDLALIARNWTHRAWTKDVVDVTGAPLGPTWGDVAFRFHGDIGSLEGTLLSAPRVGEKPSVAFNAGMRWHALTFDPPLELASGALLSRILAGPLDWQATEVIPIPEHGLLLRTAAQVPAPNANGTSPDPGAASADTGLTLTFTAEFVEAPTADDDRGVRSPALAQVALVVHVPSDVAPQGGWEDATVTLAVHFDFATAADGAVVAGPAPLRMEGVYLNRTERYATLRFFDHAHGLAGGETDVALSYSAREGYAVPGPGVQRLDTPVTLNVTLSLLPLGSPGTPSGASASFDGELGFLMPEPRTSMTGTPPETPGKDGFAAGWVGVGAALAAAVLFARRRR